MTRWVHRIRAVVLVGWMLAASVTGYAQEYVPVEVTDVKDAPQRFWARGIVFRDVLKEHPGTTTLRVDDQTLTRFKLDTLGEVYAPAELVGRISSLPLDVEYLFSATVSQRGRTFLFLRRQKYIFLIKDVSVVTTDSVSIPDQLANMNRGLTTNIYNRVFASLEYIMADVEKDLFAYATSQNISMEKVFDVNAGHMARVTSSIHSALRRAEDRSKMPAQEFLVSLIVAMMAMQHGYVEVAPEQYIPADAAPVLTVAPADEEASKASESSWDLSAPPVVADEVVPEAAVEIVTPEPEPEAETKNETTGPDDPFWKDPAPAAEATAPAMDDPFWTDPDVAEQPAPEVVPTQETVEPAVDQPVSEEKPTKKKRSKKKATDPVPENEVKQEEPVTGQD